MTFNHKHILCEVSFSTPHNSLIQGLPFKRFYNTSIHTNFYLRASWKSDVSNEWPLEIVYIIITQTCCPNVTR